jgi:hypothetical protein
MRSSNAAHRARGWVIEDIAPDFTLLDVWALPVQGERQEFTQFLAMMSAWDPAAAPSPASRILFTARRHLGAVFGWDNPAKRWPIPGCAETTLAARLPHELRPTAATAPAGNDAMRRLGAHLVPLYQTETEAAAEISNATVHGVIHFSWVEQRRDRWQGHMAVYVKPRGTLGRAYLLFIQPFRHLIVYPALLRQIERLGSGRPDTARG